MNSTTRTDGLAGTNVSTAIAQLIAIEAIGLALIRAWSSNLFSGLILFPSFQSPSFFFTDIQGSVQNLSLVVFAAVCSIAAIRCLKGGALRHDYKLPALIFMELGTAILLGSNLLNVQQPAAYAIGAITTGLGSSMLTLYWGERFSALPIKSIAIVSLGAISVFRIINLIIESLSPTATFLTLILMPIASYMLVRQPSSVPQDEAQRNESPVSFRPNYRSISAFAYILLVSITIGFISEFKDFFQSNFNQTHGDFPFFSMLAVVLCFLVLHAKHRLLTVRLLMAAMAFSPALFFALMPFGQLDGAAIWFIVSLSSFIANVAIWAYLSEFCARKEFSPFVGFGIGLAVHYAGLFLGELPLRFAMALRGPDDTMTLFVLSIIMLFIIVLAYAIGMSVYSNTKSEHDTLGQQPKPGRFSSNIALVARHFGLTEREEELLGYLARGYSSKSIQSLLHISASTVSAHSGNIYRKLGVHSKTQAAELVRNWSDKTQAKELSQTEKATGDEPVETDGQDA